MLRWKFLILVGSIFAVIVLAGAVGDSSAQTPAAPSKCTKLPCPPSVAAGLPDAKTQMATPGKPLVAPLNCKAGQMRCVTNAHRWAAAINRADKRANHLRQHPGEVK